MQRKQRRVVSWTEQELQALCIEWCRVTNTWPSDAAAQLEQLAEFLREYEASDTWGFPP